MAKPAAKPAVKPAAKSSAKVAADRLAGGRHGKIGVKAASPSSVRRTPVEDAKLVKGAKAAQTGKPVASKSASRPGAAGRKGADADGKGAVAVRKGKGPSTKMASAAAPRSSPRSAVGSAVPSKGSAKPAGKAASSHGRAAAKASTLAAGSAASPSRRTGKSTESKAAAGRPAATKPAAAKPAVAKPSAGKGAAKQAAVRAPSAKQVPAVKGAVGAGGATGGTKSLGGQGKASKGAPAKGVPEKSSEGVKPATKAGARKSGTGGSGKTASGRASGGRGPVLTKPGASRSVAAAAVAVQQQTDAQGYVVINGRKVRMISTKDIALSKKSKTADAKSVASPTPIDVSHVKTRLSQKELDHYRDLLLARRAEILGLVRGMEQQALRSEGGNLSHMPIHMADIGSDTADQDFALNLAEKERETLAEIDAALLRIEDGSYGVCQATGKPIPKARLDAKPWAKYTIEAARMVESGHRF